MNKKYLAGWQVRESAWKRDPIDLTAYFDTPEEVRMAQSVLKAERLAGNPTLYKSPLLCYTFICRS
jgi:hypothetical protein